MWPWMLRACSPQGKLPAYEGQTKNILAGCHKFPSYIWQTTRVNTITQNSTAYCNNSLLILWSLYCCFVFFMLQLSLFLHWTQDECFSNDKIWRGLKIWKTCLKKCFPTFLPLWLEFYRTISKFPEQNFKSSIVIEWNNLKCKISV